MNNNKFLIVVVITFSLGIVMLLGSSYSIIVSENKNDNVIVIPDFNNYYQKNIKIDIINNKVSEYKFEIINNSNSEIKYRIDINPSTDKRINSIINYSYNINNNELKTFNLSTNNNIVQNHQLNKNMKDSYSVSFFFSDIYDSLEPFTTTLNIFVIHDTNKYGTEVIEGLDSNQIRKNNDEIRFISNNPNNYVYFNCDADNNKCEKWRIIGSFNQQIENGVDKIKSLKIIRMESNDEMPFNKDELNGKFDNSFANSYLNGFYYENMSDKTKKLILKAQYNIGDVTEFEFNKAYIDEKKNIYYANVGLPSPSDYLFLDNDWMINSSKTLLLNKNNEFINVYNNGITFGDAYTDISFIPVVYLRSDVSFINGDGTINNPYHLDITYPLTYGMVK